jgi:hypothetical protein
MKCFALLLFVALTPLLFTGQLEAATGNKSEVDIAHSKMTVHVYKSGLFSAFGHNHEIDAPIQSAQLRLRSNPHN